MAVPISISSTFPLSTPSFPSSSISSSNSLFFNSNSNRRFLSPLQSSTSTTNNSNRTRKGLSCTCLFGLGIPELVVIAGVAALVFGPKQLPQVGKSIGKTVKSFQQAAKEFESELKKDPEPIGDSPAKIKSASNEEEDSKVSSMEES